MTFFEKKLRRCFKKNYKKFLGHDFFRKKNFNLLNLLLVHLYNKAHICIIFLTYFLISTKLNTAVT